MRVFLAQLGDLAADRFPLQLLVGDEGLLVLFLDGQGGELFLDLDLFEAAQGAQPHVEDRLGLNVGQLPLLDHPLLGVVVFADDADDLVDVEIDDHLPAQDLHAAGDGVEAEFGAALQHVAAMIEPGLQRLFQIHDARHGLRVEHVEIERDALFELGRAEERFHQMRRRRRCASWARG